MSRDDNFAREKSWSRERNKYSISSDVGWTLLGSPLSETSVVPTSTCSFHGMTKIGRPSMADVHCQNLCVVAGGCPGFDRFYQPFGDQAFRKFTLCVFETENRPAASGIE